MRTPFQEQVPWSGRQGRERLGEKHFGVQHGMRGERELDQSHEGMKREDRVLQWQDASLIPVVERRPTTLSCLALGAAI